MDIAALRSFRQVAQLRSFSKAARFLNIPQSTVSTHVSQIEKEIGRELINRETRPVQVTEMGAQLLESVDMFLSDLNVIREQANKNLIERPTVSIVATELMVERFLPMVVHVYRELHRDVHLRFEAGPAEMMLDKVERGEADLGFTPLQYRHGLAIRELFNYSRVLVVPLGHPLLDKPLLSLGQLRSWPLISPSKGSLFRVVMEAEFRRRGIPFEPIVDLRSYNTIKKYVALGIGIAVLPSLAIEPGDNDLLGIIDLKGLLPDGVGAMYHRPIPTPQYALHEFINTAVGVARTLGGEPAMGLPSTAGLIGKSL